MQEGRKNHENSQGISKNMNRGNRSGRYHSSKLMYIFLTQPSIQENVLLSTILKSREKLAFLSLWHVCLGEEREHHVLKSKSRPTTKTCHVVGKKEKMMKNIIPSFFEKESIWDSRGYLFEEELPSLTLFLDWDSVVFLWGKRFEILISIVSWFPKVFDVTGKRDKSWSFFSCHEAADQAVCVTDLMTKRRR